LKPEPAPLGRRPTWTAALLGLLVSFPYWPGGPVWDDHSLIHAHLVSQPLGDLWTLWATPVTSGDFGAAYYRPLPMTLLAVLGRVGIPLVHMLAGLLHAASAALICELGERTRPARWGALLFAAHPIGWEVLGWASALPDALAVMLGLATLWSARRHWWAGVFLAMVLALLSKESALVWLVFGGVAGWFDRRSWMAVGAAVVAVVGMRLGVGVVGTPPLGAVSVGHAVQVLLQQLGAVVWPLPLTAVHDTHHLSTGGMVLGGLALVGGVALALRDGRVGKAALAVVVLSPVLALPTVLSSHLAGDRYLYASAAAVGLWVAHLPPIPLVTQSSLLRVVFVLLGTAGVGVHAWSASAWHTDRALFERAVEVTPESSYAHLFLGHAHALDDRYAEAARAFDQARQLPHAHPETAQLTLQAYVLAGAPEAAVRLGRDGPKDGLTAAWIGWWARAELDAGNAHEAAKLVGMLQRPDGSWDGPGFVPELAREIRVALGE